MPAHGRTRVHRVRASRSRPGDRVAGALGKGPPHGPCSSDHFGGPLLMEDPMRFELKVVLSVEAVVLIAVALKVLQVW
jgi:hypothetical protein